MRGEGLEDDLADLARARCGRWLADRWRLERVLGIGGTSTVYEGTHRNGRRAALKVLHPQWAMMPTIRRRFLREGYISNRVEHPAVAAVLDDGESDDGEAFLVLELLDGESLAAVLAQAGRLPVAQSIAIARQVLSVLEAAHAKGIIHRDIKPDNLMVLTDGSVKVLDFGIASIKTTDASATLATLPGGARGTPAYMAPEQARGLPVDGRTDLWAVGAVLFRMLSGQPVRRSSSAEAMLVQAATQPAPPLQHVLPGVPPGLAALVDRALTFEPQGRFDSAAVMLEALQAAASPARLLPESATLPEGAACQSSPGPTPDETTGLEVPAPAGAGAPAGVDPEALAAARPRPTPLASRRRWLLAPLGAALLLTGALALRRGPRAPGEPAQALTPAAAPSSADSGSVSAPSSPPEAPGSAALAPPPPPESSAPSTRLAPALPPSSPLPLRSSLRTTPARSEAPVVSAPPPAPTEAPPAPTVQASVPAADPFRKRH